MKRILTNGEIYKLDGFFRAANYLSVGQLYLLDNPLLKRELSTSDIKPNVVGHWGTVPGQNFIITHLFRLIKKNELNMMLVVGPGHGGNAAISNCYLEGTYSKYHKEITQDEAGLKNLFKQFSFPGGVSSHVAPSVPGSINEGGELGYSLVHSYGAALDNPDLIVSCIIGDGEAETGPLMNSLHLNKLINPKTDGIVLPILHLNGYKISNPTILSRIPEEEFSSFLIGAGYKPYFVKITDDKVMNNESMALALDLALNDIKLIKKLAKEDKLKERPKYPFIVFSSPKGWTGPKEIDNKRVEGTFRAHQIPVVVNKETGENLSLLETWLKSYNPKELFDDNGVLKKSFKSILPDQNHLLFDNKNANGGLLLKELKLPVWQDYGIDVTRGITQGQDMMILSQYLKDVIKKNKKNFRIFSPDETLSNRMAPVFEETNRQFNALKYGDDEYLSSEGRIVDSFLSEHICEGLLEGYILTGRHGIFDSYEAFIRVVGSMITQHAKWLKVSNEIKWREDISSLNLLLTSHCWQQDHNGYTHQDPGLLNTLATKKSSIVRMYLPPDANCLLSCTDHALKTKNYINVIVASKHPRFEWLSVTDAEKHCTKGIGEWKWASTVKRGEPDLVMACAGETPTMEALAAVSILHSYIPRLKIKFINVVDLMKLENNKKHPHGLTDSEYDNLFTKDKPIIFAFHGYPSLIHELTYDRLNQNIHVHGYIEEGTITTSFDMRVQNKLDRYHLVLDAIKYLPELGSEGTILKNYCNMILKKHKKEICETGQDIEEVRNWKWYDIK